jgi:hypothetical protein
MNHGLTPNKPATGDDKGDAVKTAMTGNANFTPNPSLATVGTDVTALRAKITTRYGSTPVVNDPSPATRLTSALDSNRTAMAGSAGGRMVRLSCSA